MNSTELNRMEDVKAPIEKPITVINPNDNSLGSLNGVSIGAIKTQQQIIEPAIISSLSDDLNETRFVKCERTVAKGSAIESSSVCNQLSYKNY